jgi:hypothetical protein
VTQSGSPRTTPGARLGIGISLVLIALVCFGTSRLVEHSERHAYVKGATPPPTYRLKALETYQLSTAGGVKGLLKAGVIGPGITPVCFSSTDGGVQLPITVVSTKDDERSLHVFATFQMAGSGNFHISCQGIAEVFVDDAEDAGRDYSALFVVLSCLIGLVGGALALSGAYGLGTVRVQPDAADEPADLSSREDADGADLAGESAP